MNVKTSSPFPWPLPVTFFVARLVLILSLPLEGLAGYGDYPHFAGWSALEGWPFFHFWVEFPPFFPLLSVGLSRLAGGREHAYIYLLAFTFSAAQAGCLAVFLRLAQRLRGESAARRAGAYFALTVGLFYTWDYFDPLAVLPLLLGLLWLLEGRETRAGLALGVGALVKWFPVLALAAVWRVRPPAKAFRTTAWSLGLVALVWGGLAVLSPRYTLAALQAQGSKGSWETVWALLDGNLRTGNFGPFEERYDPETAALLRGNPARVNPWVLLVPFAGAGLWLFARTGRDQEQALVPFVGLTLCLFYLWAPGWSPQWVLYLLPLALLALPERTGYLLALLLVLVNLTEWPLLLSRGLFAGLWLTVPLRTFLLGVLAGAFWQATPRR